MTWPISPWMSIGRRRFLLENLKLTLPLEGDVAEFGVAQGHTIMSMKEVCEEQHEKTLHAFDIFAPAPKEWGYDPHKHDFCKDESEGFLRDQGIVIHKGLISEFKDFDVPLCFAHVDVNSYEGTKDALGILERVLVPGGRAAIDDYGVKHWPGVEKACKETSLVLIPFLGGQKAIVYQP